MHYGSRNNKSKLLIEDTVDGALPVAFSFTEIDDEMDEKGQEDDVGSQEKPECIDWETVYEKPAKGGDDVQEEKHEENNDDDDDGYSTSNNSEVNYSSDDDEDDDDAKDDDAKDDAKDDAEDEDDAEDDAKDEDDAEDEETEYEDCDTEMSNSACEDEYYAYIKNFPVQLICLEKCKGTLDELFDNQKILPKECMACMFQVTMTLLMYQTEFSFTHNDLHTNNIMYINTDIPFLYYRYRGKQYKVPTYGKIYKIIDYGRSIYTYKGHTFFSDSFAPDGDASTQYNTEPYYNPKKKRVEPNPSFDLCRLGTSIYDFIFDEDVPCHKKAVLGEFQKVILRWCTDDNGKNVLYKSNGEERYPNFKLYKMISRTVHHHTPEAQLSFPEFAKYEFIGVIPRGESVMEIG